MRLAVEDFKKNFGRICRNIYEANKEKYKQVNLYFQDESRFGLFTKAGRILTAKGIKPICSSHQEYSSTWLFGAFSPISDDDFMMEFPACNTETVALQFPISTGSYSRCVRGIVPRRALQWFLQLPMPYHTHTTPKGNMCTSYRALKRAKHQFILFYNIKTYPPEIKNFFMNTPPPSKEGEKSEGRKVEGTGYECRVTGENCKLVNRKLNSTIIIHNS